MFITAFVNLVSMNVHVVYINRVSVILPRPKQLWNCAWDLDFHHSRNGWLTQKRSAHFYTP